VDDCRASAQYGRFHVKEPGTGCSIECTFEKISCARDVKSRKYSRAGSKASTMILRAVVCNTCTLYNQHSPYRSLLNALEKPTDLVRLIAHISDKGIHTILC
jgi:hypothetical protein